MVSHEARKLGSDSWLPLRLSFERDINVRLYKITCLFKSLPYFQRRLRGFEFLFLLLFLLPRLQLFPKRIIFIEERWVNHPSFGCHYEPIRSKNCAISQEALNELNVARASIFPNSGLGVFEDIICVQIGLFGDQIVKQGLAVSIWKSLDALSQLSFVTRRNIRRISSSTLERIFSI